MPLYLNPTYFNNFKTSDSWLRKRKERRNITLKTNSGESSSLTPELFIDWKQTSLPTLLSSYDLRDIYNSDEFGQFYTRVTSKACKLRSTKWLKVNKYPTHARIENLKSIKLYFFPPNNISTKWLKVNKYPAHARIENLKSIKLYFFPPNNKSTKQPIDQGIMRKQNVVRIWFVTYKSLENNKVLLETSIHLRCNTNVVIRLERSIQRNDRKLSP